MGCLASPLIASRRAFPSVTRSSVHVLLTIHPASRREGEVTSPVGNRRPGAQQGVSSANTPRELEQSGCRLRRWVDTRTEARTVPRPHPLPWLHDAPRNPVIPLKNPGRCYHHGSTGTEGFSVLPKVTQLGSWRGA